MTTYQSSSGDLACVVFLTALSIAATAQAAAAASPRPTLPVDGPPFVASFSGITADGIVTLEVDGQQRQLPAADLVMWGAPSEARHGPQVMTTAGSLLVGSRVRLDVAQLQLESSVVGAVTLPRNVLRGIVLRPSTDRLARAQLRTNILTQPRGSDQLMLINGDQISGNITELDDAGVAIETDVGKVRIPTTRIIALLLHGPAGKTSAGQRPRLRVGLRDGTICRAFSLTVDAATVRATLACGVEIAGCEGADLVYLQPLGGRAVYLSDLPSSSYECVPYLTLKWFFGTDHNVLGGRLRCQGRHYSKGLGMHATARLEYPLGKPFRRFESEVAIDDAAGRHRGSVVFRVLLHRQEAWREAYTSPLVRGGDAPVSLSIDLGDADALRLEVDPADHGDQLDYANWLNPRLVE